MEPLPCRGSFHHQKRLLLLQVRGRRCAIALQGQFSSPENKYWRRSLIREALEPEGRLGMGGWGAKPHGPHPYGLGPWARAPFAVPTILNIKNIFCMSVVAMARYGFILSQDGATAYTDLLEDYLA